MLPGAVEIDDFYILNKRFQVSVFRFQDLAIRLPDTPGPDLTLYESGR